MTPSARRLILRSIHLIFSIPIIGYIYSPFENLPQYAPKVRFVFVPVIVLSGLAMWIAHRFGRSVSKSPVGAKSLS